MCDLCRRSFLRGAVAAGASALLSTTALAAKARPAPERGEFIIRNAHIMTMDATLGDIADGSIHVKDGAIVAVGKDVKAPGAKAINGKDMIVMPGLIDTHWHCWKTLYRSFSGDEPANGYFPTVARFGQQMMPDDIYHSVRLSAAEAINSGTTFIHDWFHNVRSRAHAEADIKALQEAGIRSRFSCGWAQGLPDTQLVDQATLEGLAADWKNHANGGLISLGMAWRGQIRVQKIPEEIHSKEFENARRLGLPITLHAASSRKAVGQITDLFNAKLLGKDVQVIHALSATPDEMKMLADTGTALSLSPGSELRIGYGLASMTELIAAGISIGISLDTAALTGNANLFNVLKLLRDAENAKTESEFKLSARKALEIGTIGGARSMGIDDKVGSLKPGKRADLILINTNKLNMAVMTDVAHLVLECTGPENIDTVMVDGRILKRNGKLTVLDADAVVKGAREALEGVRKRTAWR